MIRKTTMRTKQEVIEMAHGWPYRSTAKTFRGAIRAIRHHGIYLQGFVSVQRRPFAIPTHERITRGLPYNRVTWYQQQHSQRLAARMERLSRIQLDAAGLLDRQQYRALAEEWLTALDLPARDGLAEYARTKYESIALACARSYHHHVAKLYTSKYAGIVYATAPVENKEWDRYAKSYRFPCVYTDAAVHVLIDDRGEIKPIASLDHPVVVLHGVRGGGARLPLHTDAIYEHPALLDGDLYARSRKVLGAEIITRYTAKDKRTGIAVNLPSPTDDSKTYWEHGNSVAEIRSEWERKRKLHEAKRLEAAITRRQERKMRLVIRLCGKLPVTVQDARQAGACLPGIQGFRQRYQLGETATIAQLRPMATSGSYVLGAIRNAVQRVLSAKVA
jgi:hypothetical protein